MNLFSKYDKPVPRYTSYPTVPYWNKTPKTSEWLTLLDKHLSPAQSSLSMYVHVPFCESLCTYCGCNTSITTNHKVEGKYIDLVHKEWALYKQAVSALKDKNLKYFHFGGGTPTFLSPESLTRLFAGLVDTLSLNKETIASIEVDPRRTTKEHLIALKNLGFTRLSLGVQDFNEDVQRLVNRHQPFELTQAITELGRELGFFSVNFDLIYGLPCQTLSHIENTVEKTLRLKPDRIALYSMAHVPWIKPQQKLFKDSDLPAGEAKRQLYERARELLIASGYFEIGMDHFALPHDPLYKSLMAKTLHRNFMGYTECYTDVLLALGVSSISETPDCFHQNEKVLPLFERKISEGALATFRGHLLSEEDQHYRQKILKMMTTGEINFENDQEYQNAEKFYAEMLADGLVELSSKSLKITETGKPFLRNICTFFDPYYLNETLSKPTFSKSL